MPNAGSQTKPVIDGISLLNREAYFLDMEVNMAKLTEEQKEDARLIQEQVLVLYKKAFNEVFIGCMHKLHPRMELGVQAYHISKYELAVKACKEVLDQYEKGLDNLENPDQLSMFTEGQLGKNTKPPTEET